MLDPPPLLLPERELYPAIRRQVTRLSRSFFLPIGHDDSSAGKFALPVASVLLVATLIMYEHGFPEERFCLTGSPCFFGFKKRRRG
jgi:hypothetical protein